MKLASGRPLSEADEAEVRPVCVIGEEVKKQLFAGREAVGAEVSIQDVVMNIMLISVAERTREIGVKQAVGATRNRILLEFFLEAVMLTIFSGLAGLIVALGICRLVDLLPLLTLFSGLPVTPWTVAMAFGTLVIVGILSAVGDGRRTLSFRGGRASPPARRRHRRKRAKGDFQRPARLGQ